MKIKIYTIIIVPVVLYGCEILSLTLREEYRLSVFENRVQNRTFGPKRDEIIGGWRKLHNDHLHNLYSSLHTIKLIEGRRIRWEQHVARMGANRNVCSTLVGTPERRWSLGIPRRRWEDNIKIYLRGM
jgi:hypothetical protein